MTATRQPLHNPQSIAAILDGKLDPRPVAYGRVRMRSTLEADFARHLDAMGVRWTYEPRVYSGYLPDFQILRDGPPCFIEVKPTVNEVPAAQERMEVIWNDEPDAVLVVVCAQGSFISASVRDGTWSEWVELWKHA